MREGFGDGDLATGGIDPADPEAALQQMEAEAAARDAALVNVTPTPAAHPAAKGAAVPVGGGITWPLIIAAAAVGLLYLARD